MENSLLQSYCWPSAIHAAHRITFRIHPALALTEWAPGRSGGLKGCLMRRKLAAHRAPYRVSLKSIDTGRQDFPPAVHRRCGAVSLVRRTQALDARRGHDDVWGEASP
jgi:hypothetical protein